MYLLPREEKLVWANHDNPSDKKEIKLNQIVSILDKTVGEGVRKHVKRPISEQYCLISYQNEQGISKTLEFGCETHKYMRHFVHNMLLLKGHDAGAVYVGISGRIC